MFIRTIKILLHKFNLIYHFVKIAFLGIAKNNESELGAIIRRKVLNTKCNIDTNVIVTNRENFESDVNCWLYHSCYILNDKGKFKMGSNSHLGAFCYVNVYHGSVTIGNNVAIGPGTQILAYSNHYAKGKLISETKIISDISIGNNVFIGADCTILPGTIIRDNVIVGAGSIVKGELDANAIYVGTPCHKVKSNWYL